MKFRCWVLLKVWLCPSSLMITTIVDVAVVQQSQLPWFVKLEMRRMTSTRRRMRRKRDYVPGFTSKVAARQNILPTWYRRHHCHPSESLPWVDLIPWYVNTTPCSLTYFNFVIVVLVQGYVVGVRNFCLLWRGRSFHLSSTYGTSVLCYWLSHSSVIHTEIIMRYNLADIIYSLSTVDSSLSSFSLLLLCFY